jgi:hypothetical protein
MVGRKALDHQPCDLLSFRRHAAGCPLQLWPETALQQAAIPKTAGTAMLMLRFRLGAKKI